ncbi:hypothetical protein DFH29DRAFT_933367, partial [Suillus ampliporus]
MALYLHIYYLHILGLARCAFSDPGAPAVRVCVNPELLWCACFAQFHSTASWVLKVSYSALTMTLLVITETYYTTKVLKRYYWHGELNF